MHANPTTIPRLCALLLRQLHRSVQWLLELRYGRAGTVAAHVIRFMS